MGKKKQKERVKSAVEGLKEAAQAAEQTPEGCYPLFLSMKSMEKYDLKTGPFLKDTVETKWFQTEEIIGTISH